jgi:hypothetical protein
VDGLEVVDRQGNLLARVTVDGMAGDLELDHAAFELAAQTVEAMEG